MTPLEAQYTIATDPPSEGPPFQSGASDEADPRRGTWLKESLQRLDKIAQLARNWDGEDSPPTDRDLVSAARSLLFRIAEDVAFELPVPFIGPIPGGGFQLDWSYRDKYLELEFTEPDILGYLCEQEGTPKEWVESEDFDIADVPRTQQLLEWLTSD